MNPVSGRNMIRSLLYTAFAIIPLISFLRSTRQLPKGLRYRLYSTHKAGGGPGFVKSVTVDPAPPENYSDFKVEY